MPSNRFKMMFQRGVDLSTLDVTYVSSLSWYFLVNFGLRGVYRLMLGEDSDMADETRMMNMQVRTLLHSLISENFVTCCRWVEWEWVIHKDLMLLLHSNMKGSTLLFVLLLFVSCSDFICRFRSLLSIHKHTFVGDQAEKDLLGDRHPLSSANAVTGLLDLSS